MLVYCLVMAACAGATGADWQARIGHFSLEEATRLLGKPESCVGLDNGGTACSWTTSKDRDSLDKLILTFDSRGQLATADKVRF
jgi:hypothetical protein